MKFSLIILAMFSLNCFAIERSKAATNEDIEYISYKGQMYECAHGYWGSHNQRVYGSQGQTIGCVLAVPIDVVLADGKTKLKTDYLRFNEGDDNTLTAVSMKSGIVIDWTKLEPMYFSVRGTKQKVRMFGDGVITLDSGYMATSGPIDDDRIIFELATGVKYFGLRGNYEIDENGVIQIKYMSLPLHTIKTGGGSTIFGDLFYTDKPGLSYSERKDLAKSALDGMCKKLGFDGWAAMEDFDYADIDSEYVFNIYTLDFGYLHGNYPLINHRSSRCGVSNIKARISEY